MNDKLNDKPNDKPDDAPNKNKDGTISLTAQENDAGRRLDRILRKHFPAFPLSFINRLLREKKVRVGDTARHGAYRVVPGDVITVATAAQPPGPPPALNYAEPAPSTPALRIVYEDDDLLVADKPVGVLTHGRDDGKADCAENQSLESRVSAYLADKIPASLSFRPGPLHRLDRNTGGLVVFGKSLRGARFFTRATQHGHVKKYYLALAGGVIAKEEVWEDRLFRDKKDKKTRAANGDEPAKKAATRIRPLEPRNGATLIEAEISSGKTHQIRAQCALHGHPLCGDKKYGGSPRQDGYFLRACRIVIERNGETLTIEDRPCHLV
ncbi:MAG: RluA family pseudouridine synthase [Spirochaetaceae bacterium]|jgi:23S rRNA pseudouridine955/2504/2580 synthase|nr:RluA family pseudouridine synthase [Spirochaetaceae bacterium]